MEEIQNTMRATQGRKLALRDARALERFAKNPQLGDSNFLIPTDPDHGIGEDGAPIPVSQLRGGTMSGGDAGLQRIIGKGKGKKMMMDAGSNGMMEGGAMHEGKMFGKQIKGVHGGASAAKFLESGIGKELMMKMGQMKGGAFSKEFREGFMEAMNDEDEALSYSAKRGKGKGMMPEITPGGDGREVAHARMMSARFGNRGAAMGGQDVPVDGISPVAYGNAPQAPASFQRNTVGMGRAATMEGCGKLQIEVKHGDEMMKGGAMKKKRQPSARNIAISKLMRGGGMSLAEDSRHIKEHGM
jgi:hypothetical protein